MILVSVTKQKDETYEVNRWLKLPKLRLTKTHEATVPFVPSAAQIDKFRFDPPEDLRVK